MYTNTSQKSCSALSHCIIAEIFQIDDYTADTFQISNYIYLVKWVERLIMETNH